MEKNKAYNGILFVFKVLSISGTILFVFLSLPVLGQSGLLLFKFNYYALLPLLSTILNIILLLIISIKLKCQTSSTRWFSLFIISFLIWSLGEFLTRISANTEIATFWSRISPAGIITMPSILLMFILAYIKKRDNYNSIFALITLTIPTLVFIFFASSTNLIIMYGSNGFRVQPWGYEHIMGNFFGFYAVWMSAIAILLFTLLIIHYRRTIRQKDKKQTLLIIIALLIPFVGGTIVDAVLTLLNILVYPVSVSLFSIMAMIITYSIFKYSLFQLNPADVSENILETMSEIVLIIDPAFTIEYVNKRTEELLGYNRQELIGMPIQNLFENTASFDSFKKELIEPLALKRIVQIPESKIITSSHNQIPVSISTTKIMDEQNKTAGFIVAVTDISDIKDLYRMLEQKVQERTLEIETKSANLENIIAERTKQLEQKIQELRRTNLEFEKLNKIMINRETRMIEMKKEIDLLRQKSGENTPQ